MNETVIRRSVLLLVLMLFVVGCNSSDGATMSPPVVGAFSPSNTPPAADAVRLRGGTAAGNTVQIEVAIGGPTTSNDLYSFAFDLVLSDPTVAAYQAGGAVAGSALTVVGGQSISVLASQNGDRIVVGISKTGGGVGSGNGVAAGEAIVVTLPFRVLRRGETTVTITGSPGNDPAALDSTGGVIGSVAFDAVSAKIVGM